MQRDAEPEAAHARALALFADHEVEAEVLRAGAAVAFGHGHAEKAAAPGQREHLARDQPVAFPLRVASLLAHHLTRQERAKAGAEVFVHVLEQVASHRAPILRAHSNSGLASSTCTS